MARTPDPGFRDRLRWFRETVGMDLLEKNFGERSERAFARRMGMKWASYRAWEVRGSTPRMTRLESALGLLGIDDPAGWAAWLITGHGTVPGVNLPVNPGDAGDPRRVSVRCGYVLVPAQPFNHVLAVARRASALARTGTDELAEAMDEVLSAVLFLDLPEEEAMDAVNKRKYMNRGTQAKHSSSAFRAA